MIDDNIRIGNNIHILRKHRGDGRKDLGEAIGYAYSTIVAFEKGTRPLQDKYIEIIAKRYNVSFEMIKEQTLTKELLVEYDTKVNEETINKFGKVFFIGHATSILAKENENFKRAEEYANRVRSSDYMQTMLRSSRDLYYRSFKEDGVLAGAVNTLMMLFIEFASIDVNPDLAKKLSKGKLTNGEAYLFVKTINQNPSVLRMKFVKETERVFDECISVIASTDEGKVFAEYYLVLKYLFCMIDNGRSYRENVEIGIIMMQEFSNLGNTLVKEALVILGID